MPTKYYRCNICGTTYDTEELAMNCEKQPVINPHNIKVGDEIILRNYYIPCVGLKALVERIIINMDHTVEIIASFDDTERNKYLRDGEPRHRREDRFKPEQYIKFIDASLPEIADKLGEAVRNLWMAKRRAEKGWHSPEECPGKKKLGQECPDCDKCHPCMRPYADLPDSEKELPRSYPAEFIKILDGMGYMITVKPKTNN